MSLKTSLLSATISALILTGCGGSSSSKETVIQTPTPVVPVVTDFTFDATSMINNLTNRIIVGGYQDLNSKADSFYLATQTLLNTPNAESLAAAQQAWKDVRIPWEQGEAHIFGPVDALSIDPHLDTWPLNTNDLKTLLTTQSGFSGDVLKTWNDDVQGFHTMEFLLFGDGVQDNTITIDEMTLLEREYLSAAAEVFNGYTKSLLDAWVIAQDPNDANSIAYQELLLTPDNEIYSSQLGVVEELINGMIGIVDEVGNGKIAEPFGSSIDTTDTSLVESQYSWNSLADFANNIEGVLSIYLGRGPTQSAAGIGIIDFVKAKDTDVAERINDEISTAITMIKAISGENNLPFRQAINDADARIRIQAAINALGTVQTSLENDVLTLLTDWTIN